MTAGASSRTGRSAKLVPAGRSGRNCPNGRFPVLCRIRTVGSVPNSLASLWAEPAISNAPGRSRRDWFLAGAVALGTVIEVVFRNGLVWPAVAFVFGLALAGAVVLRREHPLEAALFGFGGFVLIDGATALGDRPPFTLYSGAVVLVFAFALFRWGSARDAAIGLGVMAAALAASSIVDYNGVGDIVGGAAVLMFVAVLGASIRYRGTARDQLIEQAQAFERQQMARELHDTVGHHVSAIVVQARAGLVEVDAGSLTGASESLRVIVDEATRTLTEMRSVVGVLRSDTGGNTASAFFTVADIEHLTERSTAITTVVVHTSGDLSGIAPMLVTGIYRVAQESVTNALRHARRSTLIEVAVTAAPTDLMLVVSDDGDGTGDIAQPGYGMAGMGERVGLLGGTFDAGPHPSGGWAVRVALPR